MYIDSNSLKLILGSPLVDLQIKGIMENIPIFVLIDLTTKINTKIKQEKTEIQM